jgi:transcriptional regulator with XRE-family HTH domain
VSIIAEQIYKLSLEKSKLYPNYFQSLFEMSLQKSKEGPFNQSLKNAIKHLKSIGLITQYKDIVTKTGYDKSTVSEYVRGLVKVSPEFEGEFEKKFGVSLKDYNSPKEGNYTLNPTGVNVTLQDYINIQELRIKELSQDKEWFKSIINSTLGRIHDDTHTALAYQKAWVKFEAERSSEGNKRIENELRYKMSKLVDDELKNDDEFGNHDETDSSGRAEQ